MQNKKLAYMISGVALIIIVGAAIAYNNFDKRKFFNNNPAPDGISNVPASNDSNPSKGIGSDPDNNLPEAQKQERNIDLAKDSSNEILACKVDDDCGIRFDTCNCKTLCRAIKFHYFDDCAEACEIDKSDFAVQLCKCENNQCAQNKINPFNKQPYE